MRSVWLPWGAEVIFFLCPYADPELHGLGATPSISAGAIGMLLLQWTKWGKPTGCLV